MKKEEKKETIKSGQMITIAGKEYLFLGYGDKISTHSDKRFIVVADSYGNKLKFVL